MRAVVQGAGQRYELVVLRQPREREQPHRLRKGGAKAVRKSTRERGGTPGGGSGVLSGEGRGGQRAITVTLTRGLSNGAWKVPSGVGKREGVGDLDKDGFGDSTLCPFPSLSWSRPPCIFLTALW